MATRRKTNKPHSQTLAGKVLAFQEADAACPGWPQVVPLPQEGVQRDVALKYFNLYWMTRAPSDWQDHELAQLAELAAVCEFRDRLFSEVSASGGILETEKGWKAADPKVGVWSQLSGRSNKLMVALGLTVSQGEARTAAKRANLVNNARSVMGRSKRNPLLVGGQDEAISLLAGFDDDSQ